MCRGLIWSGTALLVLVPVSRADDARTPLEGFESIHRRALRASTVGAEHSLDAVTPPASLSLTVEGDVDIGGFVFQDEVPFIHNEGGAAYGNTALGLNALQSVTPGSPSAWWGRRNSAFGGGALQNSTSGYSNTATGWRALYSNTQGAGNTGTGQGALYYNTSGFANVATGARALYYNTTGSINTAVGPGAGFYWTTGINNVAVGVGAFGIAEEGSTIRIGGRNYQTTTFVEGINDAEVTGTPVCIAADDELGLCPAPLAAQGMGLSPVLLAEIRQLEAELAALKRRLSRLERERPSTPH